MTNAQVHGCKVEGWECFHCGELFTTFGAARDHFGERPSSFASCRKWIDVLAGVTEENREGNTPEEGQMFIGLTYDGELVHGRYSKKLHGSRAGPHAGNDRIMEWIPYPLSQAR